MRVGKRIVDHLVYSVLNIDEAIKEIYEKTGVKASPGGQHLLKGTKNALINLGDECYLEILAADDSIPNIKRPRWMGIDLIQRPAITRWAIKSSDLKEDSRSLKKYNPNMGKIIAGERKLTKGGMLKWKMIEPLSEPQVDLAPFMINWAKDVEHPTKALAHQAFLKGLSFFHHSPKECSILSSDICGEMQIQEAHEVSIKAQIAGPIGEIEI